MNKKRVKDAIAKVSNPDDTNEDTPSSETSTEEFAYPESAH